MVIYSKRQRLFLTILVALLLSLYSYSALAVQSVNWVQADPVGVYSATPTTVTISAQIAADPALITSSINLISCDSGGRAIAILGRLYDDGTHGDAVAGDNIFTTQISLNEPAPATAYFKVTVAYKGVLKRVSSDVLSLDIVDEPDEAEINNILTSEETASQNLDLWTATYGIDLARTMVVEALLGDPYVQDAGISIDNQTIWIIFRYNGLEADFLTGPPDTAGSPTSSNALVSTAVSSSAQTEIDLVTADLDFDTCLHVVPPVVDSQFTLDFLKTLNNYGVISIAAHGGMSSTDDVVLQTGEIFKTPQPGDPHYIEWKNRIIVQSKPKPGGPSYWMITPSFIRKLAHFPGSIILLTTCHSLENTTLSSAFLHQGASVIFGWSGTVTFGSQSGVRHEY